MKPQSVLAANLPVDAPTTSLLALRDECDGFAPDFLRVSHVETLHCSVRVPLWQATHKHERVLSPRATAGSAGHSDGREQRSLGWDRCPELQQPGRDGRGYR
eukprot:CAMPEP_0174744116 /NCGR_PEP_ID=MMETSP1094-20130205/83361_1 /TAXON_ID=156173 /ORGANISM="Chrysochromulina brevifilum, Strain UTEX LB 985" /LENGTH=101 /DNA_ID=CAMNT_0015948433 /DNA_START=21 /DNA_END=323 /DNA_ORIENTATION=-